MKFNKKTFKYGALLSNSMSGNGISSLRYDDASYSAIGDDDLKYMQMCCFNNVKEGLIPFLHCQMVSLAVNIDLNIVVVRHV